MDRRSSSSDTVSCALCRDPSLSFNNYQSQHLCPMHKTQRHNEIYSLTSVQEHKAALAEEQRRAARNPTLRSNTHLNGLPRPEHYTWSPTRISGIPPAAQRTAHIGGVGATTLPGSSVLGASGPTNNPRAAANASPVYPWGSTRQPTRPTPSAATPSLYDTASSSIDTRSFPRADRDRPAPSQPQNRVRRH